MNQDSLKLLLNYEPSTGVFTWKVSRGSVKPGKIANNRDKDGHVRIRVNGRLYFAHALAWLYMKGGWPVGEVDHIDLIKDNNAWSNLRLATHQQNSHNQEARRNNKLGVKGVCISQGRYEAKIEHRRKTIHLGRYITLEEAKAAYDEAASILHGEFAKIA